MKKRLLTSQIAAMAILLSMQVANANVDPNISSAPPTADANWFVNYSFSVVAGDADGDKLFYSLENAPEGMNIRQSGRISWMPDYRFTSSGLVTIKVEDPEGATDTQTFSINAVDTGVTAPVGIYVSPTGDNSSGDGSIENPYATLYTASLRSSPGDTIYMRGGNYYQDGYGDDDLSTSGVFHKIRRGGVEGNHLVIRQLGDEYVKIHYAGTGIDIAANYVDISGLEVEGPAKFFDVELVLSRWWTGTAEFQGKGLECVSQHHINISDMIVGYSCNGGLNVKESDMITIENCVVYNNGWWQHTGGSGLTMKITDDTGLTNLDSERALMTGNLSFGNEQRVYSVNFGKGFASLKIDECPGICVEMRETKYGTVTASHNFSLWNGKKAIVSKRNNSGNNGNIIFHRNSTYHNGTTVRTNEEGLDFNGSNMTLNRNLMHLQDGYKINLVWNKIDTNTLSGANNHAVTLDENMRGLYLNADAVFVDPENLDFTPVEGLRNRGAAIRYWNRLKARCDDHGIVVEKTGHVPDNEYMTEYIVDTQPLTEEDVEAPGSSIEAGFNLKLHHGPARPGQEALLLWWKFDEPMSSSFTTNRIGPMVGLSVTNEVGNLVTNYYFDRVTATLGGDALLAGGKVYGLGTGWIDVDDVSGLATDLSDQVTISIWAYGANTLPAKVKVLHAMTGVDDRLMAIRLPWNDGSIYWDGDSSESMSYPSTIEDYSGRWTHWVFTKDTTTGTMAIYMDGVKVMEEVGGNTASMSGLTSLVLGAKDITGHRGYKGGIADLRIYNRLLTEEEIQAAAAQPICQLLIPKSIR